MSTGTAILEDLWNRPSKASVSGDSLEGKYRARLLPDAGVIDEDLASYLGALTGARRPATYPPDPSGFLGALNYTSRPEARALFQRHERVCDPVRYLLPGPLRVEVARKNRKLEVDQLMDDRRPCRPRALKPRSFLSAYPWLRQAEYAAAFQDARGNGGRA